MSKKKIAIIGAGISGLFTAYRLQNNGYEVKVFENNKLGGDIQYDTNDGKHYPISTLFTYLFGSDYVNQLALQTNTKFKQNIILLGANITLLNILPILYGFILYVIIYLIQMITPIQSTLTVKDFSNLGTKSFLNIIEVSTRDYGITDSSNKDDTNFEEISLQHLFTICPPGRVLEIFVGMKFHLTPLLSEKGYYDIVEFLAKTLDIEYTFISKIDRVNKKIYYNNTYYSYDKLIVSCNPHDIRNIMSYEKREQPLIRPYSKNDFITILVKCSYDNKKSDFIKFIDGEKMQIFSCVFLDDNIVLFPCNLKTKEISNKKVFDFLRKNNFENIEIIKIFTWETGQLYYDQRIKKYVYNLQGLNDTYYVGKLVSGTGAVNDIIEYSDKLLGQHFSIDSYKPNIIQRFINRVVIVHRSDCDFIYDYGFVIIIMIICYLLWKLYIHYNK